VVSHLGKLILTRIPDYLGLIKSIGFKLTQGRKIPPVPPDPMVVWWQEMLNRDMSPVAPTACDTRDLAVIMYSGGTTGKPKGIALTNRNFISEGMMVSAWGNRVHGDSILAILPAGDRIQGRIAPHTGGEGGV
jgi:long-chain acyl-CoA synthetase